MRRTFSPKALTVGGLAVVVIAAGGVLAALRDDAPASVEVRLASAQRGTVTASVTAAGRTVDGSRRDLAFGVAGRVTRVLVEPGDRVTKGQVLARVDGRAARDAYEAARADLAAAEETLAEAASCTTTTAGVALPGNTRVTGVMAPAGGGAVDGDRGGTGAPSASPSPSPSPSLSQTQTLTPTPSPTLSPTRDPRPTEPRATVTVTVTATVTVVVTPEGADPRPTADVPVTTAAPEASGRPTPRPSATAPARTAAPRRSPSGGPTRSERKSGQSPRTGRDACPDQEQASAAADRARAAVERAAETVRGTRIVAPAAGTVLSVAGAAGDTAGTDAFVSLGDLDELLVEAMVTESDAHRLQLGQQAGVTLATRPGERHPAVVTHLAPTPESDGNLVRYPVTLAFDEPPSGLMLGQSASVTVTTEAVEDALYIPAGAVGSRADGTEVVTVRRDGQDRAVTVTTGVRGDQYVEIRTGLREWDQVLLSSTGAAAFPDAVWPSSAR